MTKRARWLRRIPKQPAPFRIRTRWGVVAGVAAVTVLAMQLAACATLPDVDQQLATSSASPVTIVGASGPVSEAKAEALIDRLALPGTESALKRHLAFEQSVSGGRPLVMGNRVTLLQDGPRTYASMSEAIRAAKRHVHLETFIFEGGDVGERFSSLLRDRARAGVDVRVIYDAFGSLDTPRALFDSMRESGVELLEFNPVKPTTLRTKPWRINNRDHRKLLVIDGRIAFVGGINISNTYSSASSAEGGGASGSSASTRSASGGGDEAAPKDELGWRDTHLRIEGPAAAEFQRLFVETWGKHGHDVIAGDALYPQTPAQGDAIVRAVAATYEDEESAIFSTLVSALRHADSTAYLTIAYFAPDKQLLEALETAARRNVDVRLILPSHTDSWAVFQVGRSHYTRLLESGVRIYERQGTVTHAKTATVDGAWSTIGSSNLDWRSFLHNNEANAVVLSLAFAARMTEMFREDLTQSKPVTLADWRRRPWIERIKEWTARLGAYFL